MFVDLANTPQTPWEEGKGVVVLLDGAVLFVPISSSLKTIFGWTSLVSFTDQQLLSGWWEYFLTTEDEKGDVSTLT